MNSFFVNRFSLSLLGVFSSSLIIQAQKAPNVIFVLADEWRAQDLGYNGNKDVVTPNLDKLAGESLSLNNAISCCPVSCPYRGSLLTGQYPLTTGVFMNDVQLDPGAQSFSKVFKSAGYKTAYIGKWHIDGNGRSSYIPPDRRQGFDYWKVLECTHNYFNSFYWDNETGKKKWGGYDAYAQTSDAIDYINKSSKGNKPFLLILSWGPPHTPFETAPERYKSLYREKILTLRGNVPTEDSLKTIKDLIGYYGHITALDSCIGALQNAVKEAGAEENTIFIFTADHGAMVNSHGFMHKQQPYEESINVPFLIKYPAVSSWQGNSSDMLFNTPDIMPTLLSICGLKIPKTVEGDDRFSVMLGDVKDKTGEVLIACYQPFGQWSRNLGGREFRGLRTKQYTYVKDLNGPWLLFDNKNDKFQLNNLANKTAYTRIQKDLDGRLSERLETMHDSFCPGMEYIRKWGYVVDETETIPYRKINFQGLPIVVGISCN
jgi:arylsulfatase A-like enzyme